MADYRECPLCGGNMRLKATKIPLHVPGQSKPVTPSAAEWVCPDCDYFEEADEEKA
jgi:rubredoxin